MTRFHGNSILLIETDIVYATQLKEILEERGAMVMKTHSLAEARSEMNRCDFDMVISSHQLPDGGIRELVEWCKDSLSSIPVFAALGNCTQLEKKQLEKMGVKSFLSKSDSIRLFEDIAKALFSFDSFRKDFLDSQFEKGIAYELKVGGKKIVVRALEILDKGIFLSFETPFTFGHPATLVMTAAEGITIESCSVNGSLQGGSSEGQFFKVNDEDLVSWRKLLNQLDKKQGEVTEFLKRASGK